MNFRFIKKIATEVIHGFRAREALNFLRAEDKKFIIIPEKKGLREDGTVLINLIILIYLIITRNRTRAQFNSYFNKGFIKPTLLTLAISDVPKVVPTFILPQRGPTLAGSRERDPPILTNISKYYPYYIDAKDAITFVILIIKQYYDLKHKSIFFKIRDIINLRLYRSFSVLNI